MGDCDLSFETAVLLNGVNYYKENKNKLATISGNQLYSVVWCAMCWWRWQVWVSVELLRYGVKLMWGNTCLCCENVWVSRGVSDQRERLFSHFDTFFWYLLLEVHLYLKTAHLFLDCGFTRRNSGINFIHWYLLVYSKITEQPYTYRNTATNENCN